ncbi:GNAT family N-acetyltransferase [Nocardioides psychrotolerans]|uniref:GNAT family N-acetyltransferase n=1 Tax=Nocardioides psychrotolerans TaxID=1005945 RepID=UPI00313786B2
MAHVEFFDDPGSFLDAAGSHLQQDPVLTTVVSSVSHQLLAADRRGETRGEHPRWWAVVREGDDVGGVAMRTAPFAPYWLYVLSMPETAARALARAVLDRGETVTAVNGALVASGHVADEISRATGGGVKIHEHMRLWEVTEVVAPELPAGLLRQARSEDVDLAVTWWNGFAVEAAEQAGSEPLQEGESMEADEMARRIDEGLIWVWEDQGHVVHLTAHNPPSFGVARVGPVYTPREARGRGYASAAVAAVSRRLLDEGVRACLFTDQANPTSNKIYEAIGYRPVEDMVNLVIR